MGAEGIHGRETAVTRNTVAGRVAKDDLKWYLMNKYRALLVERLTPEDLDVLHLYQQRQRDQNNGRDNEYVKKFVMKVREYVREEILMREIIGIDALVMLMKPEDLVKTVHPVQEKEGVSPGGLMLLTTTVVP